MNAGELHDLFRLDTVDYEQPYFWSDEEIFRYMDDAYVMFVRLMDGIGDVTSTLTRIPIVAGNNMAKIDYRILKVRDARLQSNNHKLHILNLEDEPVRTNMSDYGNIYDSGMSQDFLPGKVHYMIIGEQDNTVQWVQVPIVNDVALLRVFRLPLKNICAAADEFEGVRPYHHIHFLKWMRYHAYSKQDSENFNKEKATTAKAEFEAYCVQVKAELARQRSKPKRVVKFNDGCGSTNTRGVYGGYL